MWNVVRAYDLALVGGRRPSRRFGDNLDPQYWDYSCIAYEFDQQYQFHMLYLSPGCEKMTRKVIMSARLIRY